MAIENFGKYDIYGDDPSSNANLPEDAAYAYDPKLEDLERDERPSDIAIRGTSTTNPQKPRTIAAGYDREKMILTVVFRGNIWWNYYDVPEYMWLEFVAAESKGKYLRESGLDTWDDMGPADTDSLGRIRKFKLNRIARLAEKQQKKSGGQQKYGGRSLDFTEELSRRDINDVQPWG
jgi:hypothetical protein